MFLSFKLGRQVREIGKRGLKIMGAELEFLERRIGLISGLRRDDRHENESDSPMKYNPDLHHRRSIRLKGYDYPTPGSYFVTIRVQNGLSLFGRVRMGNRKRNEAGFMIGNVWTGLPQRFPGVAMDELGLMRILQPLFHLCRVEIPACFEE